MACAIEWAYAASGPAGRKGTSVPLQRETCPNAALARHSSTSPVLGDKRAGSNAALAGFPHATTPQQAIVATKERSMTKSKLSALTVAFFAAALLLVACGDDACPNGAYLCSGAATCAGAIYGGDPSSEACVDQVCAAFGTADCTAELMAEQNCAVQNSCSVANCQAESAAADACTGI